MDKIKVLFVLFVIALFIAGCAQPEVEPETQPETEPETEPEVEVEPEPEPEPKPEMSEELKAILEKNLRVTSFEYRFRSPTEKQIKYFVTSDKIRATLPSHREYNDFKYYDIYMNTVDETAYLVCDDVIECKGKKALTVSYDEFKPETPLEVVRAIEYGEITEYTQIENKNTVIVSYLNKDGNQERIWIWVYWGMPLQRQISIGGDKVVYYYDGLVINAVKDEDVTMPIDLDII